MLIRHYDPAYQPSLEFLTSGARGAPIPRGYDVLAVQGTEPLPSTVRDEVGNLLARLVAGDGDPQVRHAALVLRQSLAFSDPVHTRVTPGAITLLAGCGSRVVVWSTSDIDLMVRIGVLGAPTSHTYGVGVGRPGAPTEFTISLPKGVVVASFGGREIARLASRNAPCAPGQPRLDIPA